MDKYHLVTFVLGIMLTLLSLSTVKFLMTPEPEIIIEQRDPDKAYLDVVSKTEYYANETGQTIVRISDGLGNPLSATCNATIIFPNKTMWMIDQPMSASSISGNYYMTMTIPDVLGVYEYKFDCIATYDGAPYPLKRSSSFHVSIAYQKFQEIMDMLDELNSTIVSETGILNSTIMDKLYAIQDEITSVNDTIKDVNSSLSQKIDDQSSMITIYYGNIMEAFYNLQQRWLDQLDDVMDNLIGTGQSLNKIGDTLGISPSVNCGLFDRLVGNC